MAQYARVHDANLWECLNRILQFQSSTGEGTRDVASLPLVLGVWGFAVPRTRVSAYWASWADCMPMINSMVVELFVRSLEGP